MRRILCGALAALLLAAGPARPQPSVGPGGGAPAPHPARMAPQVPGQGPARAGQPGAVAAARPFLVGPGSPAETGQWVQTVLQRPLFSPSRRPSQQEAAPTELPRLAGIVIAPRGAFAIFSVQGRSRAVVAGEGARVGPYLVRQVSASGVSVEGPAGLQRLHPTFDPNAPRGASAPAAPGQPPPSILDLLRGRLNGSGPRGSPGLVRGRTANP